jgi:predicted negative regulator of RcsB-dependent stress response
MALSKSIQSYYDEVIRHPYWRRVSIAVLLLLVVGGSAFGYWWYSSRQEEHAQRAFSQSLAIFHDAMEKDDTQLTDDALQSFQQGYRRFASSSYAPYFLIYESALQEQQKYSEEARSLLEKALDTMSKRSSVYYDYVLKLALMKIDAQDVNVVDDGRTQLEKLIKDKQNPLQAKALYYQGLFYFLDQDRTQAERVWSRLFEEFGADSVWAQKAQSRLDYTT